LRALSVVGNFNYLVQALLGPVYLAEFFLQQFVDSLYKAELMPCSYST